MVDRENETVMRGPKTVSRNTGWVATLDRWFDKVLRWFAYLAAAVIGAVVLIENFDVLMRYFFRRPTSWAIDLSSYALIYITFFGAGWVLSRKGHVRLDLVVERASQRWKRIIGTTTCIIGSIISLLFVWYGTSITIEAFRMHQYYMSGFTVPKWPILIVLPIGSLLMTIQFLRRAVKEQGGWVSMPQEKGS